MCCLFGMSDYGHHLSGRQKSRILYPLSIACEERGTDATGMAYCADRQIQIHKKPVPAHRLHPHIPGDAYTIMGHTRLTTQGSEKHNYNNHPFEGRIGGTGFALAHNGVLRNDTMLRRTERLPKTKIETDSYVAVQLLEQLEQLSPESLRMMAEAVEGTFTFTVLDDAGSLYVVKGDNPFCLYHFPDLQLYLYASTEGILQQGIQKTWLRHERAEKIPVDMGEILCIDKHGEISRSEFDCSHLLPFRPSYATCYGRWVDEPWPETEYLMELKAVASAFGICSDDIDHMIACSFGLEEIEEVLYCRN